MKISTARNIKPILTIGIMIASITIVLIFLDSTTNVFMANGIKIIVRTIIMGSVILTPKRDFCCDKLFYRQ